MSENIIKYRNMTNKYSIYYKSHLTGTLDEKDIGFCQWIDRVEEIVGESTGFRLLDLPDEMYMPNFENGMSIFKMASIIIKSFHDEYDHIVYSL
jgi:hypothetical protein